MRPLRQRNLLGLELGRHLLRRSDGWEIRIPGEETKNHRPIEVPFPSTLVPALERYLAHHRPLLLARRGIHDPASPGAPAGQHLWVTRRGLALTAGGLQKLLRRRLAPRFGHAIGPDLFRDCAATSLGEHHPEHVRIAAQILGHTFRTSERHYIVALQNRALQHHHARIAALRKAATVATSQSAQRPGR